MRRGTRPIRCFTLGDCALLMIWMLFAALVYYFTATLNDLPPVDWAVFGGAVLCVANDRSSAAPIAMIAIPFYWLGALLRIPPWTAVLLALGCSGVLLMTYRTIRGSRADRENLRIGALLPMFVLFTPIVNSHIVHFTPHLYDVLLLKADFGVSAAVRGWVAAYPALMKVVVECYIGLPLAVIFAIAATSGSDRARLLWSLCLASVLVMPCYVLMPAVGPIHVGQPNAFRNCMPSMHLTWAALLWINTRHRRSRWLFLVFIGITAVATLATGEHYAIDLAAAIPFTWAVYRMSSLANEWAMAGSLRALQAILQPEIAFRLLYSRMRAHPVRQESSSPVVVDAYE
jgi:hypothetical protein